MNCYDEIISGLILLIWILRLLEIEYIECTADITLSYRIKFIFRINLHLITILLLFVITFQHCTLKKKRLLL